MLEQATSKSNEKLVKPNDINHYIDNDFIKSKEYQEKQDELLDARLKLARLWIMIGVFYYVLRAVIIIWPTYY